VAEKGSIRVLIVDDDPMFLDAVEALIQRAEGIEVVGRAASGDEALRRTAELVPDVVTMDLEMPVMNGAEATRIIAAYFGIRSCCSRDPTQAKGSGRRSRPARSGTCPSRRLGVTYCRRSALPWRVVRGTSRNPSGDHLRIVRRGADRPDVGHESASWPAQLDADRLEIARLGRIVDFFIEAALAFHGPSGAT
jgi:CheY-like chemotaxis protein